MGELITFLAVICAGAGGYAFGFLQGEKERKARASWRRKVKGDL